MISNKKIKTLETIVEIRRRNYTKTLNKKKSNIIKT